MAFPISVKFPVTLATESDHPISSVRLKPTYAVNHKPCVMKPFTITTTNNRQRFYPAVKAVDESKGNSNSETSITSGETSAKKEQESESGIAEFSKLGSEMKKRKAAEKEGNLLSGVGEEIKEIEWPVFGKVFGTTGVVLGIIAGSSVVLLTVNAVLAELSDRVFAGRGVQDFFG